MTRDERQDLAIEKWKKAGGRGTLVAGTGFGSLLGQINYT